MNTEDIIRSWTDPSFRATLADAPAHPVGLVDLSDAALAGFGGGNDDDPAPVEDEECSVYEAEAEAGRTFFWSKRICCCCPFPPPRAIDDGRTPA